VPLAPEPRPFPSVRGSAASTSPVKGEERA